MFNLSIVGSLVAASSYDLMNQIYGFMDIVGWVGYTGIIILMLSTLFQLLIQAKYDKTEKRTGGDNSGYPQYGAFACHYRVAQPGPAFLPGAVRYYLRIPGGCPGRARDGS